MMMMMIIIIMMIDFFGTLPSTVFYVYNLQSSKQSGERILFIYFAKKGGFPDSGIFPRPPT